MGAEPGAERGDCLDLEHRPQPVRDGVHRLAPATSLPLWIYPGDVSHQGFSAEQKKELYQQTIFARRPIGIICGTFDFTAEDVALAREMGAKHIIFLGFHPEPIEQTSSIVIPNQASGYLAAQHLMARGHRHLALVQPDDAVPEGAFVQRLEGMRTAIAGEPAMHLDLLPLHLSLRGSGPDDPVGF